MYLKAFFPVECLEDILRHLNGSDLIICTEVAPEWNDFIGSTRWCMQKIRIKIYSWKDYIEDVEVINRVFMNSFRKYEYLLLIGDFGESLRFLLAANKKQWTQVFSCLSFETVDHFLEFCQIIEPSVQKLTLEHGIKKKYFSSSFDCSEMKFSNLKSLKICDDFVSFYDKTFISCRNLERVSISMWLDQPKSTLDAMRNSLKCNKKLKSLELYGGMIFSEDFLTGIIFKLTTLSIIQVEPEFQSVFNSFLKTQRDSLEDLSIGRRPSFEIMKTILSMPRLNKVFLSVKESELRGQIMWLPAEFFIQSLPQNFSVSNFDLRSGWATCFTWCELFFKALPNIKSLKITLLDDESADVIAKTCKFLKQLEVEYFNAKAIANEDFYLNLEKLFSENVDEDSQQLFEKLNGIMC